MAYQFALIGRGIVVRHEPFAWDVRCRLVVLVGYNPVSNQCLVRVHGGGVLYEDLLLAFAPVSLERLGLSVTAVMSLA